MCGIVGVIANKKAGLMSCDIKAFSDLLFVDTLRGKDSTGVFSVDRITQDKVCLVKDTGNAYDFMMTKEYDAWEDKAFSNYGIMVGHNRAATRGGVSNKTAHPFHEGHIALIHNGTLNSYTYLCEDRKDIVVDSHAIAYAISSQGWREVVPYLSGAYALVWYDMQDKRLCITTNGERPLWYCVADDGTSTFFASEWKMLDLVTERNGIKLKQDRGYKFFPFMPFHMYEISQGDCLLEIAPEKYEKKTRSFLVATTHQKTTTTTTSGGWKDSQDGISCVSPESKEVITFEVISVEGYKSSGTKFKIVGEEVVTATEVVVVCKWENWKDNYVEGSIFQGEVVRKILKNGMVEKYYVSADLTEIEINEDYSRIFNQYEKTKDVRGNTIYKDEWDELAEGAQACDWCGSAVHWNEVQQSEVVFLQSRKGLDRLLCPICAGHDIYTKMEH